MERVVISNDLCLRRFIKNQDEKELFQVLGQAEVVRHMASEGISKSDCRVIINESLEHWEKHKVGSWAIEKDGVIAGWAGFKLWRKSEFELLIVLGSEYWGLGKSIYTVLIALAKDKLNLKSLVVVLPDTRKSYSYIVKKAGFEHVGSESFNGESFQKFALSLDND